MPVVGIHFLLARFSRFFSVLKLDNDWSIGRNSAHSTFRAVSRPRIMGLKYRILDTNPVASKNTSGSMFLLDLFVGIFDGFIALAIQL